MHLWGTDLPMTGSPNRRRKVGRRRRREHGRCRIRLCFARRQASATGVFAFVVVALSGCLVPAAPDPLQERITLRNRALECLKRGVRYGGNPAVRAGAVEALRAVAPQEGREWIRAALLDAHPGVRFAACLAIGEAKDIGALEGVRRAADDPDASVRAAAAFALHRLGLHERSGLLPELLLTHPDPVVRSNAAMLLGRTGEKSAVPVLARAMRDRDPRVQNEALEAMAVLDVPEAISQLAFLANSGIGSQETFAVTAISRRKDTQHLDLLTDRLANAMHLETRLAAARGLAWLGRSDGVETALAGVRFNQPRRGEPDDPPDAQIVRIRTLAIDALGAMDDPRVLPVLTEAMNRSGDPRLQVAAARAILNVLQKSRGASGEPTFPLQAQGP